MVGYSRAYAEAFAETKAQQPTKKRGRPRKNPVKAKPAQPKKVFPNCRADFGFPSLMQDIKPFVSPIDGTEISSRSKLKAHEQKHGVKQAGDYKPGEIVREQKKRVEAEMKLAEPETISWD
jgi:hypothetical protein